MGTPMGVGGLIDKVNTPDFATAVGLLKYGFADMKEKGTLLKHQGGPWKKIKDFFGI